MNDLITDIRNKKLYFFNYAPWRMMQISSFFPVADDRRFICKNLQEALDNGLDKDSIVFIYGIIEFPELEVFVRDNCIPLYRIEDGFIRSVALGSSFAKPYSLCFDSRGIYFDPRKPSDLEYILQNYEFDDELIERAKIVRDMVIESKFSKYNHLEHKEIEIPNRSSYDKVILVTGQVEDDMSIKYGAFGLNNSDLLEMVKKANPNSFIMYKPHPDVLSGNRVGHIAKEITEACANLIVTDISIDSCINACDELHTLTSGAGFDALLRGKKVFTYGMPFYAGWGLTTDYRKCERRTRELSIEKLIASTLILFPTYISPKTNEFCEVEQTLQELKEEQEKYFNNIFYRYWVNFKGYILPRGRKVLRATLKPLGLKF